MSAVGFPRAAAAAMLAVPTSALLWLGGHAHAPHAATDGAEWTTTAALLGCVVAWGLGLRAIARWRHALETRVRAVVDRAPVGITVIGPDGRVLDANAAFGALVDRPREAIVGQFAAAFSPAGDAPALHATAAAVPTGAREPVEVEQRFVRPDGTMRWGRVSTTTIPLAGGIGRVGVVQDITEQKGLEARLVHQAMHDLLTDLPNRALLLDRIAHALTRAERQPGHVVVLLVDVDGFRRVNDALGAPAGDQLLVTLASRLRHATRGVDTVARIGIDEFAVLLEDVAQPNDVQRVIDRLRQALARPVPIGGTPVAVRASIGVAGAADGSTPESLLRDASVATTRAKRLGGDRTVHFAGELERVGAHQLALEVDLRAALAGADGAGTFHLLYQPILELAADGAHPVAAEALVRWQHPQRGLVSPADFVPLAEETGLVVPLGRWVLHAAVRQAAAWRSEFGATGGVGYVSVNVAAAQLRDDGFVDEVRDAIAAAGLPPAALLLELTETALVHDTAETLARLAALRALGVRIAIDDFGTGYSSLAYLHRFPVDVLKIDRMFVDGLRRGGSDAALARTIVALGSTLGLDTVAEGVETAEQADALRAMGCRYAQGFLFARPMPPAALALRLHEAAAAVTPVAVAA